MCRWAAEVKLWCGSAEQQACYTGAMSDDLAPAMHDRRDGGRGRGCVTGLAGVLVWTTVARFETMEHFYLDLLGLAPRTRREHFVNFDLGPQRLTVTVHSEVRGPATDPLHVMVNLAVDDITATHERLRAAGLEFIREPELEPWGGQVATLADPDGNLLQLFQLP